MTKLCEVELLRNLLFDLILEKLASKKHLKAILGGRLQRMRSSVFSYADSEIRPFASKLACSLK